MRFILLFITFLGTLWLGAQHTETPLVYARKGLAINGYDPVAYFRIGEAVKGNRSIYMNYLGIRWQFSSELHRSLFESEPTAYLPQYGGYCAYGMAGGGRYRVSGRQWEIYDGKLYLFYPLSLIKAKWQRKRRELLPLADKHWEEKG